MTGVGWLLGIAAVLGLVYAAIHAPAAYARAAARLESAGRKAEECNAMRNGHTAAEKAFCAEVHHTLSHAYPIMVMVDDLYDAILAGAHRLAIALAQSYVLASAGNVLGVLRGAAGG